MSTRTSFAAILVLYCTAMLFANPIDIGTDKQLFIDDYIISSLDNAFTVLNQPIKYTGNPILGPKADQRADAKDFYGTGAGVMYDKQEKIFKLWYVTAGKKLFWKNGTARYATSTDGINWNLPKLGLFEVDGSKDNNVVFKTAFSTQNSCIFKDTHESDPARRYKMIYSRQSNGSGDKGVGIAFSPDGIAWTRYDKKVHPASNSPLSVMWDAKLEKYIAHVRKDWFYQFSDGKMPTRSVLQCESSDFETWQDYGVIMTPDEDDKPQNRQMYNMEWMAYENVYIGFLAMYHVLPGTEPAGKLDRSLPWLDKTDIQLTFSRDNRHWTRAGRREIFLPTGQTKEDFDFGMIYPIQPPLIVGDEIWIYYVGFDSLHHGDNRGGNLSSAIGLAKLKLDGFVSIDSGGKEHGGYGGAPGQITTKLFKMAGDKLIINADASMGIYKNKNLSTIKVEILDEKGTPIKSYTKQDCDNITTDSTHHTVTWKGKSNVSRLKNKPIAIKFYTELSKIYSFTFEPEK